MCWDSSSSSIFQSTLSVRRATAVQVTFSKVHPISIHALRKESDLADMIAEQPDGISIHALRKESDWKRSSPWCPRIHFNPRSP